MKNQMNRKSATRRDSQRPNSQYQLPHGFERPEQALKFRKDIRSGLRMLPKTARRPLLMGPCTRATRCMKGLCPICVRRQRKALVRFAEDHQLHEFDWFYLTIRIEPWVMDAGDYQSFTDFIGEPNRLIRDVRLVKSLLARLKRQIRKDFDDACDMPPLLVVGSAETFFKFVANKPRIKPFHLHLLISGIEKRHIVRHAEELFGQKVYHGPVRPVHIVRVKRTPQDFARTLTYCLKQPYKKENFVNDDSRNGNQVWAQPKELAELTCNFGPITLSDRLILVGIRYENGKFRMV